MPSVRSDERTGYRSHRDNHDSLPSRYLPQQSFPSQRDNRTTSRPRTPPLPPRREYRRPPRKHDSSRSPRRDCSSSSNPFRRTDSPRRPSSRRPPERNSRSYRFDRRTWLPPIRNPARYIGSPSRENSDKSKYPERELTPIPASRRLSNSYNRSRSPVNRGGPRTPPLDPLEQDPPSDHSQDQDLLEEENEIFDIVRRMLKKCYESNREIQANRFAWLKDKMLSVYSEIQVLQNQHIMIQDLGPVDSTDRQQLPGDIEHDLNGEELDYREEEPSSSYRHHDDYIKSPSPEGTVFYNHHVFD